MAPYEQDVAHTVSLTQPYQAGTDLALVAFDHAPQLRRRFGWQAGAGGCELCGVRAAILVSSELALQRLERPSHPPHPVKTPLLNAK